MNSNDNMKYVPEIADRFVSYLVANKKIFSRSIVETRKNNPDYFYELAVPMLTWAAQYIGQDYERVLADGYCFFVSHVNKAQMMYERSQKYQNHVFREVYDSVYGNDDFMSKYHWGVYVITFAWEHHLKIARFYRDEFICRLSSLQQKIRLLELGSGSGLWGMLARNYLNCLDVEGIDVSVKSVKIAQRMVACNGMQSHINYTAGDAIQYRCVERHDAVVSCFLLEHLEKPEELLISMKDNIMPGSYAFLTAALTAAEVDHISEFKHESEVVNLAEKAGFRVLAVTSTSPDLYSSDYKYLPRSMALCLQRRRNNIW
jgi:2-polyprenyl-3-methyl-5-hydroxy-6-metoxy-1,4-benzoquinol methylase